MKRFGQNYWFQTLKKLSFLRLFKVKMLQPQTSFIVMANTVVYLRRDTIISSSFINYSLKIGRRRLLDVIFSIITKITL